MNEVYNRTIHFGSGKEGKQRIIHGDKRAKELGLYSSKQKASLSGYICHLIDEDMKKQK